MTASEETQATDLTLCLVHDLKIEGQSAYGWANCAKLADNTKKVGEAPQLKNADNYRLFALAVFLNRVSWNSYGKTP